MTIFPQKLIAFLIHPRTWFKDQICRTPALISTRQRTIHQLVHPEVHVNDAVGAPSHTIDHPLPWFCNM